MSALESAPVEPRLAASVVLLREGRRGPEVLYLRRNPDLKFHGGYWVFPGGRIDDGDYDGSDGIDPTTREEHAARRAAVREAREEAGLDVPVDGLRFVIHWTTPVHNPIRFATWFFAAAASAGPVVVDGDEIHDHQWLTPADALAEQATGAIKLAAPTFALTTRLADYPTVDDALTAVAAWPVERLIGRIHETAGGRVALYWQDVAFESGRIDEDGPRHRLWMESGGWRYERRF